MDGANELDAPLPNVLVDHVADRGELGRGIAYWLGNAMLDDESRTPQQIAEDVDAGKLDLCALPRAQDGAIRARITQACEERLAEMSAPHARALGSCASASVRARRRCATC